MDLDAFAQAFIERLQTGGFTAVRDDLQGYRLPPAWEDLVGPFFDDLQGRPLVGGPRPVTEFSRAELRWAEGELPEPLDRVEHVIEVRSEVGTPGEDGHSRTAVTFPVLEFEGRWKVVLAG